MIPILPAPGSNQVDEVVEMLTSTKKGKSPETQPMSLVPVHDDVLEGLLSDAQLRQMASASTHNSGANPIVNIQSVKLDDGSFSNTLSTSRESFKKFGQPLEQNPVVLPVPIETLVDNVKRNGKWVKSNRWTCVECRIYFEKLDQLKEHQRIVHSNKVYIPNIRRHTDPVKGPAAEAAKILAARRAAAQMANFASSSYAAAAASFSIPQTTTTTTVKRSEKPFEVKPAEEIVRESKANQSMTRIPGSENNSNSNKFVISPSLFKCAECGSKFQMEASLKKHVYLSHDVDDYAEIMIESMKDRTKDLSEEIMSFGKQVRYLGRRIGNCCVFKFNLVNGGTTIQK